MRRRLETRDVAAENEKATLLKSMQVLMQRVNSLEGSVRVIHAEEQQQRAQVVAVVVLVCVRMECVCVHLGTN